MFIGTWLINLCISVVAFLLVFIGSMSANTVPTSLFRGLIASVTFFLITYFFRWLWKLALAGTEANEENDEHENSDHKKEPLEGNSHKIEQLEDNNSQQQYSDEEINKASQYVKSLLDDK